MASIADAGRGLERFVARYFDAALPDREPLPRYVAPLPAWLEDLGLRLAWPIALVNLAGTAFGFWYYTDQLSATEPVMWPFVPDSPVATLLIALSLIAWRLDLDLEWLHALAFFGCLKLGLWTPFVQLFVNWHDGISVAMWVFLIFSHLAMAVEAFVIHRYADFRVGAVAVAAAWYLANDVVDYLVPVVGEPHHTVLRGEVVDGAVSHATTAHDLAAAAAVTLTLLATFLALATRVAKLRAERL